MARGGVGIIDVKPVDLVPSATRSRMMAAVKSHDTGPERAVRSALFAAGYRYRLHRRDLSGSPDIVLSRFRTAIFVHGCFWHGHDCPRGRRPASNTAFWNAKLDGNIARDRRSQAALRDAGWHVEVIWQCSLAAACERVLVQLDALRRASLSGSARELTR
jgi:DNA mismatch endonuclease (patch repair protein)